MKFKLYLSGIEEEPIIVKPLTYDDALSMSEDIFGDRVSRLERLDEVHSWKSTVYAVRPIAAYPYRPHCQALLACAAPLTALDNEPPRSGQKRLETDAVD